MSALSAGWANARLCRSTCFSKKVAAPVITTCGSRLQFFAIHPTSKSLESTEHAHLSTPKFFSGAHRPPVFSASTKYHVRGAPILIIITGPSTPPFLLSLFFFLLPYPIFPQLPSSSFSPSPPIPSIFDIVSTTAKFTFASFKSGFGYHLHPVPWVSSREVFFGSLLLCKLPRSPPHTPISCRPHTVRRTNRRKTVC